MEIESVVGYRCVLGESPYWDCDAERLYWVDSIQGDIHTCRADGSDFASWRLGGTIGALAVRAYGGAIVAGTSEVYFFDFESGERTAVGTPERDPSATQLNDAKLDRRGRFFVTAMSLTGGPDASLHRLDTDLTFHLVETGIRSGNAPCWSPDDTTFYFVDSLEPNREMWAYDYDLETGSLANRRPFSTVRGGEFVVADGGTTDAEGFVWSARYGAAQIVRLTPDGEVDRVVDIPTVRTVTSVAFGGPDLDTLFVTSSASVFHPAGSPDRAGDHAGELISVRGLGITGVPEPKFAG